MLLVLRRGVATRSKKIPVQLLKDWPRLGKRGEIVEVSEGLMRNKLHANNGAAYVLKNQPLSIPIYTRPEVDIRAPKVKFDKKIQEQAEVLEPQVQEKPKDQPSVIDFLKFPGQETEATESGAKESAEPEAAPEKAQKFEWENEIVANISKNRRS